MSCDIASFSHVPPSSSGKLQAVRSRAPDTTANLGRVLVWMKPSYLGDAVMATCLIDTLAGRFRQRFVRCGGLVSELYSDRAEFLNFVKPAKIKRFDALLIHAKELRQMNLDAAILVDRSFRSALAARLARIPVRIGHSTEGRRWLLTHSIRYDWKKFEADCYLDLLATVGIACNAARPNLAVSAGERLAGAKLVGNATVGINPGGRHHFKQLPYETTVKAAQLLQAQGYAVALFGSGDDMRHAEAVKKLGLQPDIDLVGKTTVREAMGALSNLKVVFGSDSGLMHLAAALGTPTVTVFGKEPASKWGYQYEPHVAIQAPNGQMDRIDPSTISDRCIAKLTG